MNPSRPSEVTLQGIAQRLLRRLFLPLLVLLAVSAIARYYLVHLKSAEAIYDHDLLGSAVVLVDYLRGPADAPRLELTADAEQVFRANGQDRIFFAIYDAAGHLVAGDRSFPRGGIETRAETRTETSTPVFYDTRIDGRQVRAVIYPLHRQGAMLQIQVAETMSRRERTETELVAALFWPNVLVVVAAALLIAYGVRSALEPLLRLRDEVASRLPRDLQPLSERGVPIEVRPLVTSLNNLFALLREQADAQQRFIENAAHQLKTPLAALQTQLELASMDADPVSLRNRLLQLEALTERIAHLAHQLLALARSEPGASSAALMRDIDLKATAENIASTHLDFSLQRGIDLGFELDSARVTAVPWLLQELMSNLVDNALRYTPRGGNVTVRCGRDGGSVYFEVEDDGPGIPVAERDRIFTRFYRLAETGSEGCGLGLAIVREIAEVHAAQISVEPGSAGRGSRFRVSFPAEAA
jgi:two-component system sensor histidine kinase TctE